MKSKYLEPETLLSLNRVWRLLPFCKWLELHCNFYYTVFIISPLCSFIMLLMFLHVKHFESPCCWKCAAHINSPCCSFFCLSVCRRDYTKRTRLILMKLGWKVETWAKEEPIKLWGRSESWGGDYRTFNWLSVQRPEVHGVGGDVLVNSSSQPLTMLAHSSSFTQCKRICIFCSRTLRQEKPPTGSQTRMF